ncbi:MAG: molybdopterin-dependent oxidoreductase [Proteobacteria bacterium]|nr:molybdopterin-dependent oxidoreductase [Pseudomonadota bacterium]
MLTETRANPRRRDVIGACPLDCPDACSWVVSVENGRAVELRANRAHPFTGKTLCVKVNPYLSYSANPDRLLYPMRRVGSKGEGRFARITWDEALDEIATRLRTVIDRDGAEAIWPYAGTGTVGWIQGIVGAGKRLFHYLGASRNDTTICSVSGHAGMSYTTGSAAGMDPEDLAHSALVLLWGTNTLVSNRHLWPFIAAARDRGAAVVTIDPIRTQTAARSDLHLALRPGTDGALALALMHQLVVLGAEDCDYLAQRTLGWAEFRDKLLGDFPPGRAADICGIDESQIIDLAERIAASRPTGIRSLMGMQRHQGAGQALRVLSCLPAVTGDYHRHGGGMCYSTAPTYQLNKDALRGSDLGPRNTRSLATTRLGQGLLELKNPPVNALVMWAANPIASNPQQQRIRRGLSRKDLFFVLIEHFQTDTADYADILLPGTMQTEHTDMEVSFSHLYLNWNEPAVTPPGECLPHTEMFRRLARRMDLAEPALYDSDDDLARAALASEHPALRGITLEALKAQGWVRLNWPTPYQPFLDRFFTPSGKFEFRSTRAEADGVGLYPHYTPPAEAAGAAEAADADSLALVASANNFLINSIFANSPHHKRAGTPIVTLHPLDAERRSLIDGSRVRIYNERGSFYARLRISDDTRPGVAATTKGHWPKHNNGATINATVMERDSDMARGAVFHDNRVSIEPALE